MSEYDEAWVNSAQGRYDSIKFAIQEMAQLYTDYIRRKDTSRMDKDKMIELLDFTAMYIGEFLHIMGAKKTDLYDMFMQFFQETAFHKGYAIQGYLHDDLVEGNGIVLNEMKQKENGDFV